MNRMVRKLDRRMNKMERTMNGRMETVENKLDEMLTELKRVSFLRCDLIVAILRC
jgi:hypothetical protein